MRAANPSTASSSIATRAGMSCASRSDCRSAAPIGRRAAQPKSPASSKSASSNEGRSSGRGVPLRAYASTTISRMRVPSAIESARAAAGLRFVEDGHLGARVRIVGQPFGYPEASGADAMDKRQSAGVAAHAVDCSEGPDVVANIAAADLRTARDEDDAEAGRSVGGGETVVEHRSIARFEDPQRKHLARQQCCAEREHGLCAHVHTLR